MAIETIVDQLLQNPGQETVLVVEDENVVELGFVEFGLQRVPGLDTRFKPKDTSGKIPKLIAIVKISSSTPATREKLIAAFRHSQVTFEPQPQVKNNVPA